MENSIRQALAVALRHHLEGELNAAEPIYRDILGAEPEQPEALRLLGVLLRQRRDPRGAIDFLQRAAALRPDSAETQHDLGLAWHDSAASMEAITAYTRAIELKPDFADAFYNRGNTRFALAQFAAAAEDYRRAALLRPGFAEACFNAGLAADKLGDSAAAAERYREALRHRPDYFEALLNLGLAERDLGEPGAAPTLRKALEQKPDCLPALYALAVIARTAGQWDEAESWLQRVLQVDRSFIPAFQALADIATRRGSLAAGADHCRAILDARPGDVPAHFLLAVILYAEGKTREAARHLELILQQEPGHAEARLHLALCQLRLGNYLDGFANYEARWNTAWNSNSPPRDRARAWDGSPLAGKAILLRAEQGFGDSIQFIRFAPPLAGTGAIVYLECQPELVSLFRQMKQLRGVFARGETPPHVDVESALIDLPRLLKTTTENLPRATPYLAVARNESLRHLFEVAAGTLRVGLVWAGNPRHVNDSSRSMRLADWAPIWSTPGPRFYSLQAGAASEQVSVAPSITDLSPLLVNFQATAEILMELDLLIAADTAAAHLAGALGKPLWLLNAMGGDWRFGDSGETSLWYPTARIFRQAAPGAWKAAIQGAADQLRALTSASP